LKLPNYEQAVVAEAKIVRYLLNESHPRGKEKAAFFLRFGFSITQWKLLGQALIAHAAQHEVASTLITPEGIHYTIEDQLQTPDSRNPFVRSVWAIDAGSETPRLITAYPIKKIKDDEE
jgi:hypothetical protein